MWEEAEKRSATEVGSYEPRTRLAHLALVDQRSILYFSITNISETAAEALWAAASKVERWSADTMPSLLKEIGPFRLWKRERRKGVTT